MVVGILIERDYLFEVMVIHKGFDSIDGSVDGGGRDKCRQSTGDPARPAAQREQARSVLRVQDILEKFEMSSFRREVMARELPDPVVSAYSQDAFVDLDGAGFAGVVRPECRYEVIGDLDFGRVSACESIEWFPVTCG